MMIFDNFYPAELRKGQAIENFLDWMEEEHGIDDVFYLEDHKFDEYWITWSGFKLDVNENKTNVVL